MKWGKTSAAATSALVAMVAIAPALEAHDLDLTARLGVDASVLSEQELADYRGAGIGDGLAGVIAALPPGASTQTQVSGTGTTATGSATIGGTVVVPQPPPIVFSRTLTRSRSVTRTFSISLTVGG